MEKELEKLRDDCFLELYCWAGLSDTPGTHGIIITNDKKIYEYHNYQYVPADLEDKIQKKYISEGYPLKEETYLKLVKYIEKKILNKEFEPMLILDASFTINGNYQGTSFNIVNHIDMYDKLMGIIEK